MKHLRIMSCPVPGCADLPQYGYGFEGELCLFCENHRLENMVLVEKPAPADDNVSIDGSDAVHVIDDVASNAASDVAVNVANEKGLLEYDRVDSCKWCVKCGEYAAYGAYDGSARCSRHRIAGDKRLDRYWCLRDKCTQKAAYRPYNKKTACYCEEHKTPDMSLHQPCAEKKCRSPATHGRAEDGVPLYCSKHAKPGMKNLMLTACEADNCFRIATHGTETRARFCHEHCQPSDVRTPSSDYCPVKGCWTRGCFRVRGQVSKVCYKHGVCTTAQCSRISTYAWPRCAFPVKCDKHKEPGMTLVGGDLNRKRLVSQRCTDD